MNAIEVYTDGSATTKDKPGGWAFVLVINGKQVHEDSGVIPNATNNDAELEAALKGLGYAYWYVGVHANRFIMESMTITLCSDSQIVLGWATGTYRFKQEEKKEKGEALKRIMKMANAQTRWVEGHAGHEFNERCDKLARAKRREAMGIAPKKESSKSTLMLRAIKEIAMIATQAQYDGPLQQIHDICKPFLGK